MTTTIQTGDLVTLKPEFQDAGDELFEFRVVEANGERLLVVACLGLAVNPTYVVARSMLATVNGKEL